MVPSAERTMGFLHFGIKFSCFGFSENDTASRPLHL